MGVCRAVAGSSLRSDMEVLTILLPGRTGGRDGTYLACSD